MGKPTTETLPGCAELLPCFRREIDALVLVALKHIIEFASCAAVDDDGILLVVETHAAGIEIGAANGAETTIDHHDFRVVEARLIEPHVGTALHELMGVVEGAVRSQRDVALGGEHNVYLDASFEGTLDGFVDRWDEGEVGVDDMDRVLCIIDGVDVEIAHHIVGGVGFAVDDANKLVSR